MNRGDDPVLQRRESARRLASVASRAGYALIGGAVVVFFIGVFTELNASIATASTVMLIAGCVLLAPAIILGYAVKAAEREDAERGR
jgi:hypothetical protein